MYLDLQGPLEPRGEETTEWCNQAGEEAQHHGMDLELGERYGAEWGGVGLHVEDRGNVTDDLLEWAHSELILRTGQRAKVLEDACELVVNSGGTRKAITSVLKLPPMKPSQVFFGDSSISLVFPKLMPKM
jgi:hypothetical protein